MKIIKIMNKRIENKKLIKEVIEVDKDELKNKKKRNREPNKEKIKHKNYNYIKIGNYIYSTVE